MRIFLFEYTTGGGLYVRRPDNSLSGRVRHSANSPAQSNSESFRHDLAELITEGAAMITALATDFAALDGHQITILRDARSPLPRLPGMQLRDVSDADEYQTAFAAESAGADLTVVIAPECEGILLDLVECTTDVGGRLLGPSAAIVRLAGDKHATAEHLRAHGVSTPAGCLLSAAPPWPASLQPPLVLKPRDGAGSLGLRQFAYIPQATELPADAERYRVERYCPGLAASVAVLCGPASCVPLAPCEQTVSSDGCLSYLGGCLLREPQLAERARRLAMRAVATLPEPRGYLGVDLVLGADDDGRDDVVIEINPRLTTSYVGLRAAARENLAAAMLDVAAGRTPHIDFGTEEVEFNVLGVVQCASPAPQPPGKPGG